MRTFGLCIALGLLSEYVAAQPHSLPAPDSVRATKVLTYIRITWKHTMREVSFELRRSLDASFRSGLTHLTISTRTDNIHIDQHDLAVDTKYFYQVRATKKGQASNWSTVEDYGMIPRKSVGLLPASEPRYGNAPTSTKKALIIQNLASDGTEIASLLQYMGFQVELKRNLSLNEMQTAIKTFAHKVNPKDTVFIFFAGHGLNKNGEAYLLPKDDGDRTASLRQDIYRVSDLVNTFEEKGSKTLLFLDVAAPISEPTFDFNPNPRFSKYVSVITHDNNRDRNVSAIKEFLETLRSEPCWDVSKVILNLKARLENLEVYQLPKSFPFKKCD